MIERILPVVDLLRGQVVHGVAGERGQYRAIESSIVDSPHPGRVARALCSHVDVSDLYVADLDAIAGDEPDWNAYDSISNRGQHRIWLDAGAVTPTRIERIIKRSDAAVCRVIVPLETLPSLRTLEELVARFPRLNLVFSLDMKAEKPITSDASAGRLSPETIASYAVDAGVTSMIVLDLASVGGSEMMTVDLCRKIRSRYPDLELVSGGGVQSQEDVQRYVDAGCDRVLVATALHRGRI